MRAHLKGNDDILLIGGPYHLHVFVGDAGLLKVRFPEEPALDIYGKPSICAPRPTDDGQIEYVNTWETSRTGSHIFRYKENRRIREKPKASPQRNVEREHGPMNPRSDCAEFG